MPIYKSANIDGKQGKHKNFVKSPQPGETQTHIVAKINEEGKITNYVVYKPNLKNPTGFDEYKRVDLTGGVHKKSGTGEPIPTPHTQSKSVPGGVRETYEKELPIKKEENNG